MWSKNKYVNIAVNVLLFLVAINFLYYGQLILPLICLILFIDRKFQFKVNNIFNFVVLCLFSISFWFFSKDLGFYSTMGFCVPMAYYIGSNLLNKESENIKKLIYILAFGMACHALLDFAYDISYDGFPRVLFDSGHRDFWTHQKVANTLIAVQYCLITACAYFACFKESNKTIKIISIITLILLFFYNIGLGRRTPVFLLFINIIVSFFVDFVVYDSKPSRIKLLKKIVVIVVLFIFVFAVAVITNIASIQDILSKTTIGNKFLSLGLKAERFEIFVEALKIAPNHYWGGQEISTIIGNPVHDFWSDIYDYAGIIPFSLMLVYTIQVIIKFVKKSLQMKKEISIIFFASLFIGIILQMMLEPIMTGCSILLICVIIISSTLWC